MALFPLGGNSLRLGTMFLSELYFIQLSDEFLYPGDGLWEIPSCAEVLLLKFVFTSRSISDILRLS